MEEQLQAYRNAKHLYWASSKGMSSCDMNEASAGSAALNSDDGKTAKRLRTELVLEFERCGLTKDFISADTMEVLIDLTKAGTSIEHAAQFACDELGIPYRQHSLDEPRQIADSQSASLVIEKESLSHHYDDSLDTFDVTVCTLTLTESGDIKAQSEHVETQVACAFVRMHSPREGWQFARAVIDRNLWKRWRAKHELNQLLHHLRKKGVSLQAGHFYMIASNDGGLKEGKLWLLGRSDKQPFSSEDLIRACGRFQSIPNQAKRVSRIGLLFSGTIPTVRGFRCSSVDDVRDGGDILTDGCGCISPELMFEIIENLKAKYTSRQTQLMLESEPVVVQFRHNGAKGMLLLSPELEGRCISLRTSLQKFEGLGLSQLPLEVVDLSRSIPAKLGHQCIILLEAAGVSPNVFLDFHEQRLTQLCGIFERRQAVHLLSPLALADSAFGSYEVLLRMVLCGFDLQREPYLYRSLVKLFKKQVRLSAKKLHCPGTYFAKGVPDPLGVLKEGEVFFKRRVRRTFCSQFAGHDDQYFEGEGWMFRYPSYCVGDVRPVEFVRRHELEHLHDVYVFSTRGKRSEGDKCSGGDYDGDWYMGCAEPVLMPTNTMPPSDYRAPKATEKPCESLCLDICQALEEYSDKDAVGLLDWLFGIVAGQGSLQHDNFHQFSYKLGQLFGIAIDAPKTGCFVSKRERDMLQAEYFRGWPAASDDGGHINRWDYAAKYDENFEPFPRQNIHESPSTLGEIFRRTRVLFQQSPKDDGCVREPDSDLLEHWQQMTGGRRQQLELVCQRVYNHYRHGSQGAMTKIEAASRLKDASQETDQHVAPRLRDMITMEEREWERFVEAEHAYIVAVACDHGMDVSTLACGLYATKFSTIAASDENAFPWSVVGKELCDVKARISAKSSSSHGEPYLVAPHVLRELRF